MSGPATANVVGGLIAEALGLPKDRTVSLRLTAEVGEVIKVEAVIYPTTDQIHKMIALAKVARAEHPDAFAFTVERTVKAVAIVMDVLGEPVGG